MGRKTHRSKLLKFILGDSSGSAARSVLAPLFFSVLMGLLVLCPRAVCAYPIKLSFKSPSGQAVPNIKIRGTRGINSLTLLISDAKGEWSFDTNSLSALDGVIVFSGVNAGVSLSPAELKVSELVAQGVQSKVIRATPSTQPSTIVSWSFYSSGTTPLRDLPVSLLNPQSLSCEQRRTDERGYVVWSVPRPQGTCDGLSNETDWLRIVPSEPPGVRCSTFSTYRSLGVKLCPTTGDDEAGVSAATCTSVSNPVPSLNSKIQISIQAAGTTQGVQGVELVGNSNFMALPSRFTDNLGNFSFTIGSVPGASITTAFEIVPIASGYEFIPRKRDSRECSFAGNNTYACEFSAIRTFSPQGALVLDVAQAGQPLSGVSVVQPMAGLGCMDPAVRFSDAKGRIVVPVRTRSSCATLPDTPPWRTPISLYPGLTGKRFTSSVDFQYCPTQLLTTASIQAYDEGSGVQNYSIRGRVVALDGGPFEGVPIFLNGGESSRTDADGRFEIFPIQQGTSAKIEARHSPYAFDPEFETFASVGSNIETVIVARAPDPLGGVIEPPEESCPVKTDYTLRGRVLDRNGAPLSGARIHNNNREEPSATTDENGYFSLLVPFGSDNWVTVEHEAALFSPAGRSLVETVCDDESLDFQQVDFESAVISGLVSLGGGGGVSDVTLKIRVNGVPLGYDIGTGHDGSFMFTAPLGSEVELVPDPARYTFSPPSLGPLTVGADMAGLAFVAQAIPITYPTSIPTPSPTTVSPPPTTGPPTVQPTVQTTVQPTVQPTVTAAPTAAPPGLAPPPQIPTVTPTTTPPQPSETAISTPKPVDTTPWQPTPTSTAVIPPTRAPSTTVAPEPTSVPVILPTGTSTATSTPVSSPTAVHTQPPMDTLAPISSVAIAPLCDATGRVLDWLITNQGSATIDRAYWRVFDASQPSNSHEGSAFRLAPVERLEVLNTPPLGIEKRNYRMMVYMVDDRSRQIPLAVASWDMSRCVDRGLPPIEPTQESNTPTPVPSEGTTPTPVPSADTTPSPVATMPVTEPQVTRTPSSTATPEPTPTVTSTPTPSYEVQVVLKNWLNGRRMTSSLLSKLAARGVLIITGRNGTEFDRRIPLFEFSEISFDYSTSVPAGSYRLRFEGVRVVSVFRRNATSFTCTVGLKKGARNRCSRIPFALQPSSETKLTGLSRGRRS